MLEKVINVDLIRNPYNWVVVFLMVASFALAWSMLDPLQTMTAPQGEPV